MDIINKYFPDLSRTQLEQFSQLSALYEEWNSRINVISRKDIEQLYERHILHSLAIAKYVSFVPGTTIMDVGTGGGFPGIPLAIMFPQTSFLLVDSIAKKIKVVQEISGAIGLQNLEAEQNRAEEVKRQFDFIVSRAVTAFPKFVSWVKTKTKPVNLNSLENGILYLKGGDFEEEIKPYSSRIRIFNLEECFDEEFFVTKKLVHMRL